MTQAGAECSSLRVRLSRYKRMLTSREMPLYEDLVRRAVEAGASSAALARDSRLIRALAQILRDADAGKVAIRRCSWCDRFEVGGEWLHLEAIGSGQLRIRKSLTEAATHGICDECQERELSRSEAGRRYLRKRREAT